MLTIDGSHGGGQILRTALSYSAVSGHAVRVMNIRAGRPRPGLRAQHLVAVNAVAQVCAAEVTGARAGATEVTFRPQALAPPAGWRLDIGTAGSVMLVLQALLPCLALAPTASELTIAGGTNNPWAPPFEYFSLVLLPLLERMGVQVEVSLARRGFYPRGGGEVRVRVTPAKGLRGVARSDRGDLRAVRGVAYSAGLPTHIVERMAASCRSRLADRGLPAADFALDSSTPSPGVGCGIIAIAESERAILAADTLGERGKPAETVGAEAADALIADLDSGATVDVHMADQLVPWVALAHGESLYLAPRRTEHLLSAISVAEQILGARFELAGSGPVEVRCIGARV